ncbi:uncharacterized protein Tco025E_00415 [Trypanosoma conorhini]|uniref:Uncharacterized protein n=1 Tax=Trypanosoma conorhini TaxID=83891 RepID=A0A3R7LHG7_9TRYP|nr:uncharacterized protein Tco025E_00415 [Trypanosoma conorhini]RNF27345.1 hypothetical protein Tco025E_00415 [Trypanosoma conorhini]
MEELQGTLRQAQCAVLEAQRDLIALRRMRAAGDAADAALALQSSSQAKQEEAVRHLEHGTRLLCGLLEENDVGVARQAMRRYFEGQLELQRRREAEFQLQLAGRDSQLAAAQDAAAGLFQRALSRRLQARLLGRWLRRALGACADRQHAESGRQLKRLRDTIASRYAATRSSRERRARCFYRWRAQRLQAALETQRRRAVELEAELRRSEQELRCAALDFQQHVSRDGAQERRAHDAISRLEQEREEEVVRLKNAMDEMAYEFSERTSNYVRQQEELARHYAERERRLTHQLLAAEARGRKEEERATQLAAATRARLASLAAVAREAWTAADTCVSAKVELLHRASRALLCEAGRRSAELTERLVELAEQAGLVAPLSRRVALLQGRCEVAERHLDAARAELQTQVRHLRRRATEGATLLHRAHAAGQLRRNWASWRLHAVHRRLARVRQAAQVELEEAKREVWATAAGWQARRHCAAVEEFLQDEPFRRRCLTALEEAARQSLCHKAEREVAETRVRAELLEEARQSAWLRETVSRLTAHVELWKQTAKDAQLTQLQDGQTAQFVRFAAMEHEERLALHHEELCEQQSLQQGLCALRIGAVLHEERQALRVELDGAAGRLQDMGCLLVEYCARDAFSRWLLFSFRRKGQRGEKHMSAIAGAAASWLSASTGLLAGLHDAKLKLFFLHTHPITASLATAAELSATDAAAARVAMENTQAAQNTRGAADLRRYGALWVTFAATAANWFARRECLCLEFCQEVCAAAAAPVAQAMRLLSTERLLMAEHVRVVVEEMRAATTEALEAQRERHETLLDELVQYQNFLEDRIATAGVVDEVAESRNVREQHEAYEARARRDMAEMARHIESLQAELRASNERHEEEACALRSRLRVQEEEAQQAAARTRSRHAQEVAELRATADGLRAASVERHEALDGIARQYERVLLAFQQNLAGRRSVFLAAAGMLRDVEYFSAELLRQSEADLQQLSEARRQTGTAEELRELQAVHESETAALTRALQTSQELSERRCRELREQHEAYEARARRDMAEMARHIESLQAELRASNERHEEEACALRSRLRVQEEEAQQAAARTRSRHAQEVAELRATADGLRAASVERRGALDGQQPSSSALRRQLRELQLEKQCSRCRLQEAEGRRTLLCEALQGMREVCRVIHRALVAAAEEQARPSDCRGTTHFCRWLMDGATSFAQAVAAAACEAFDAKSRLVVACGVGVRGEARPGVTDVPAAHVPRGEQSRRPADASLAVATPLRRSVSTNDVTRSMLRYSKMLNEQRCKNNTRLQRLDGLVTQFDDLIERGRAVSRLERSASANDRDPAVPRVSERHASPAL